ncbi:MAG: InlB B-repeat-containing protein [Clostridiales Family XIII bacterium]|nr:InlB B-repeat-containing protein [Clostridiales Family XIII bacterium]
MNTMNGSSGRSRWLSVFAATIAFLMLFACISSYLTAFVYAASETEETGADASIPAEPSDEQAKTPGQAGEQISPVASSSEADKNIAATAANPEKKEIDASDYSQKPLSGPESAEGDKFLISFKDAGGKVIDSVQASESETIPAPSGLTASKIKPPSGWSFEYWYVEGDENFPPADFYAASPVAEKNLYLVPFLTQKHTVIFISEGDQVPDPMVFVDPGDSVGRPADPTRAGWAFAGWEVDDGDGGRTHYDFGTPVSRDLILYASWTAVQNAADYTIIVWMEKPNLHPEDPSWRPTPGVPGEYDYVFQVPVTGATAGEEITFNGTTLPLPAKVASLFTTHAKLKYAEFQDADSKVIQGNGSTVIGVYMSRKVYTWALSIVNPDSNTQYRMTIGGTTYDAGSNPVFSFSAKYEDSIGDTFASAYDYTNPIFEKRARAGAGDSWNNWAATCDFSGWDLNPDPPGAAFLTPFFDPNFYVNTNMISFDGTIRSYHLDSTWNTSMQFYYYRYFAEALDGDIEGTFLNLAGTRYKLLEEHSATVHSYAAWLPVIPYAKDIPGYSKNSDIPRRYSIDGSTWTADNNGQYAAFFYRQNIYTLAFDANMPPETSASVKDLPAPVENVSYGQGISSYEPATVPTLEGYRFAGWYKDPSCTELFEFGISMPNSHVTVFAGWKGYTVTFYDTVEDGNKIADQNVPRAGYIDPYDQELLTSLAAMEDERGAAFDGWYWHPVPWQPTMVEFDPSVQVYGNYDLYARWKTGGFKITYEPGEGVFEGFSHDLNLYDYNVLASIKDGAGFTQANHEGYVFDGWKALNEDATLGSEAYQANDSIQVKGDVTFIAQYRSSSTVVDGPDDQPDPGTPDAPGDEEENIPDPNPEPYLDITPVPAPIPAPIAQAAAIAQQNSVSTTPLEDNTSPLSSGTPDGGWALLNLILAGIAVVFAFTLLIHLFAGRHRDGASYGDGGNIGSSTKGGSDGNGNIWRTLAIILGIVSPIAFLLTEDVTLHMVLVDMWTLLMAAIVLVQLMFIFVMRQIRKAHKTGKGDLAGKAFSPVQG